MSLDNPGHDSAGERTVQLRTRWRERHTDFSTATPHIHTACCSRGRKCSTLCATRAVVPVPTYLYTCFRILPLPILKARCLRYVCIESPLV